VVGFASEKQALEIERASIESSGSLCNCVRILEHLNEPVHWWTGQGVRICG
jgi:hypothetical protein